MSHWKTKLHFLGGNNKDRIGASAQLIEHEDETGKTTRILIDFGALFPPAEFFGKHFVPNIAHRFLYAPGKKFSNPLFKAYYFDQIKSKSDSVRNQPIDAIFLTHMHEDHIGGIVDFIKAGFYLPPIYASKETLSVLGRILIEEGISEMPEMYPINNSVEISKSVTVTPFPVSHTVLGSYGYHILTKYDGENHVGLINMGDFNLSDVPLGLGYDKEKFKQFLNNSYVTHVLTDSTSVSNKQTEQLSFEDSIHNYASIMKNQNKRIVTAVISRSTQNMASIIKAAKLTGRKVFIDGQKQRLVYEALEHLGELKEFESTVFNHLNPTKSTIGEFLSTVPLEKQVIILSGAFAEGLSYAPNTGVSGMVKLARGNHKGFKLDNKSLVILSQRAIPVGSVLEDMRQMAQQLAEQNCNQIIQNQTDENSSLGDFKMIPLQRSGHASFCETVKILDIIRKNRSNTDQNLTIIPVHGDEKQIKESLKCAKMVQASALAGKNQDEILLDSTGARFVQTKKEPQQWLSFERSVEGSSGLRTYLGIELYEEIIKDHQVSYKKIMNLGNSKSECIHSHEKESLLKILNNTIERRTRS